MPSKPATDAQEHGPTVVNIEKLVYGGDGLARVDGQIALIPFVLPGERVAVHMSRGKAGMLRGHSPEILEASPERTAPGCEYFGNCGGCHYQHANYPFQLDQKSAILRETLRRLGGITHDGQIRVRSGPEWEYRNRIQLHFERRRTGFRRADSHELCAITHCPISSPMLNQVISQLQSATKRPEWPEFLRSLELFTNEHEVQVRVVDSMRPIAARFFAWCETFLPSLTRDPIEYTAAGNTFRVSSGSFFQVNRFLIDALVEEVLADSEGAHAIDLYAGAGLFSAALGARFQRVDAVERNGPGYRDLEWNSSRSRLNIRAIKASAEDFLRAVVEIPELIVADPPRAGLERGTVQELLRIAAPRLTLVSCDIATLARDLKKLAAQYRIESLTLVDLFPQTYHLEAVVQLVKGSTVARNVENAPQGPSTFLR